VEIYAAHTQKKSLMLLVNNVFINEYIIVFGNFGFGFH